jgi:hypothetical protein
MTLLYVALGIGVLALIAWLYVRAQLRTAARKILGNLKALYGAPHETRPAQISSDVAAYYDEVTAFLESRGFTRVGDLEDLTIANATGLRSVLRLLASEDTVAEVFEVNVEGTPAAAQPLPTRRRCLGLRSEMDGRYVVTSNGAEQDLLDAAPEIDVLKLPLRTTAAELLRVHRDRLAAFPNARPLAIRTLDECREQGERMRLLQLHYRRRVHWLKRDEVNRLSPSPQVADAIWPLIQSEADKIR